MGSDQLNVQKLTNFFCAAPQGKSQRYNYNNVADFLKAAESQQPVFTKDQIATSRQLHGVLTLPLGKSIVVSLLHFIGMKQTAALMVAEFANKFFKDAESAWIERTDPSFYDPTKEPAIPGSKTLHLGGRNYDNIDTFDLVNIMIATKVHKGTVKVGDTVIYGNQKFVIPPTLGIG